jgi:AraC-like DNA-binding protein
VYHNHTDFFGTRLGAVPASHSFDTETKLDTLLRDPDMISVRQLSVEMGMSEARVSRLCRRSFGVTPKLLLRSYRFTRMLAQLDVRPYSEWRDFLDPQYVDQSHFIREFRFFTGLTPSAYLARLDLAA